MSTFFFLSLDIVLYPAIKSGADLTKNPIPIMNNPTIKLSISIVCQFFIIVANEEVYANVGDCELQTYQTMKILSGLKSLKLLLSRPFCIYSVSCCHFLFLLSIRVYRKKQS